MTRLKDLATINRAALPKDTDPDFTFRYVDISSVDGLGRIAEVDTMSFGAAPSRARRLVKSGDTIISTVRTYLRAVAHFGPDADNTVVSTGFATLTPNEDVDARFLYWLMRSDHVIEDVVARSVGVSYPAINAPELGQLSVPAPDLGTQRRIASFLDTETCNIDALVDEQLTLRACIAERRQAEIDGWIEHGNRPSSDLQPVDSPWLDAVPTSWQFKALKHCVDRVTVGIVITPSAYYEESGVPVLRGLNVRPGRVTDETLVYMSEESNQLHAKSILRAGDVVVVRTGLAGAAAMVPDWAVGGNAVDLLLVRPGAQIAPPFLEHLLNSRLVQRQVAYGSVGALQAHFNVAALANVAVTVPPLEEQLRITEHLRGALARYDELAQVIDEQVGLLREHRRALITTAVTRGLDAARRKVA